MAVKVTYNAWEADGTRRVATFDADTVGADPELPGMFLLEKFTSERKLEFVAYIPQDVVLSVEAAPDSK